MKARVDNGSFIIVPAVVPAAVPTVIHRRRRRWKELGVLLKEKNGTSNARTAVSAGKTGERGIQHDHSQVAAGWYCFNASTRAGCVLRWNANSLATVWSGEEWTLHCYVIGCWCDRLFSKVMRVRCGICGGPTRGPAIWRLIWSPVS